ncbi:MAG: hypothetical protein O7C75_09560 [Verrucomicrobia bacterium]|nr:hypothetical protein [Verrucomicrobiota bacterium]
MSIRFNNITAVPHPNGNRIDLKWVNPDPDEFPGVRVVRREGSHPTSAEDGIVVVEGMDLNSAVDNNLKGETVYYYMLFPYEGDPPEYQFYRQNRTSATATAPYNIAGRMYNLLPALYHRYDTVLPKTVPDGMLKEDEQRGQLRRFIDLPGHQLDQLFSFAKTILDSHNLDKVDGRLLPLLAQWIGWKTDHNLEIETQRNEIRNAPTLYKTIGIIPTVEATVKRISGWESRTKEFVHNVFLSNRPERMNLWLGQRSSTGQWLVPSDPLSLDFAYEGRPTASRDQDGVLWLFYHTFKKGGWEIWYKAFFVFETSLGFQNDLDNGNVPAGLIQMFNDKGFPLFLDSTVEKMAGGWLLTNIKTELEYTIQLKGNNLTIWTPSRSLTEGERIQKYPTAALQGDKLWVFWNVYDETDRIWRIDYRTRTNNEWSNIETFSDLPTDRRKPWAIVDHQGGLWLFWLERVDGLLTLKYNRHDGTDWQLDPAASFPLDGIEDPRVEDDMFVLFHPAALNQRIWVFWARKDLTAAPERRRWTVVYRVKRRIDPTVSDWSVIRSLPKDFPDSEYDDNEPAALVNADGNIEVFWNSNRGGSWSIVQNILDAREHTWGTSELTTDNPYSQRNPLPIASDEGLLLIFRSNESLTYHSKVYGATETVDFRYAGCTTVDTRNAAKISLRDTFDDFQTYTYAVGEKGKRTNDDQYARDTIGLYLTPDTSDQDEIDATILRIEKVLEEFMPITDRTVFIT